MSTLTTFLSRRLLISGASALALGVLLPQSALAFDEDSNSSVNVDASGLALRGYDPVAYVTASRAIPGQSQFTASFGGANYRFVSAANRDTFVANPAQYVPAFGGFCAMGVALEKKLDVDPQSWRVVDGKLYLNVNKDVQKRWLDDVPGNIANAEKNWPRLKDKVPKSL
jgi:YHS domain-containing protein